MCLALPGRIVSINDDTADVDFGGVIKKANITMVETKIGDWVVVHAGFAIEIMDEEEAHRTIDLWNEVLAHDETDIR
ncbi:MAG: HypC/HybG/HupF family hydrogenase formation chaperone [Methanomassiliicoccaceae archaeon]|jgi:hydrogenase expression/formation protein HypC|nr:HypC/HybG/HupF family hydrogenase formation chaperone [Methanomassiliicoccaceae archaeon]